MMDSALERLRRTQVTLGKALEFWDGADLASIERTTNLLEASAMDLRELQDAITQGTLAPTAQLRSPMTEIRNQIRSLTRLVDASSAFVQGLAVYAGTRSSSYDASGRIQSGAVQLAIQDS